MLSPRKRARVDGIDPECVSSSVAMHGSDFGSDDAELDVRHELDSCGATMATDEEVTSWVSYPFLEVDPRSHRMTITDGAREALKGHTRPLAVLAITGPARSGKSSAVNVILGGRSPRELRNPICGARVGDTTNPCTEGVNAMPLQRASELWSRLGVSPGASGADLESDADADSDFDILFLDSEGTEALNREAQFNTNLLTILFLISSAFVYNTKGAIDESALERLTTVVQAARRVMSRNGGDAEAEADPAQRSQVMPSFLWVVRDFMLRLVNAEGEPIDADRYLDGALSITPTMPRDKRMLRLDFVRFFRRRGCRTLSIPHHSPEVLRSMGTLPLSEMMPNFQADVAQLRAVLPFAVRPRQYGGQAISGDLLLQLMEVFVSALNAGAVPEVKSAWAQVAEARCRDVVDAALERLRVEVTGRSPLSFPSALDVCLTAEAVRTAALSSMREQGLDGLAAPKALEELETAVRVSRSLGVSRWVESACAAVPTPPLCAVVISSVDGDGGGGGGCGDGAEGEYESESGRGVREQLHEWLHRYSVSVRASLSGCGGDELVEMAVLGRQLLSHLPASVQVETRPCADDRELQLLREQLDACRDRELAVQHDVEVRVSQASEERSACERERSALADALSKTKEALRAAEADLESLGELQARVEVLTEEGERVQAEAAEQGARADAELAEMAGALEKERRERRGEADAARCEAAECRRRFDGQLRQLEAERKEAVKGAEKAAREFDVLRAEMTTRGNMLASERDRLREEVEAARRSSAGERQRLTEAADRLRAEMAREREAHMELSAKLRDAELRAARADMAAQSARMQVEELRARDSEVSELRAELDGMRAKVARLTGENKAQKDARIELAERLRLVNEELASTKAEMRRVAAKV